MPRSPRSDAQDGVVPVYFGFSLRGVAIQPETIKAVFNSSVEWFASLGLVPSRATVVGAGMDWHGRSFKSACSKLEEHGFGDVKSFRFETKGQDKNSAPDSISYHEYHGSELTCYVESARVPDAMKTVVEKMRAIMDISGADYGNFWAVQHEDMEYEVEGLPQTVSAIYHDWEKFGSSKRSWRKGQIGRLTRHNVLPEAMMKAAIAGTTLQQWIAAAAHRGNVERFTDNTWLWTIALEDRPAIFKALWDAGMIFDAEKYMFETTWYDIDDALLDRAVDGVTLRHSIISDPYNGELDKRTDGSAIWGLVREFGEGREMLYKYALGKTDLGRIVDNPESEFAALFAPADGAVAPARGRTRAADSDPHAAGFTFFVEGFMSCLKEYASIHDEENSDVTLKIKTRFKKLKGLRAKPADHAPHNAHILVVQETTQASYPRLPFGDGNPGVEALNAMRATSGGTLEKKVWLVFEPASEDPRDWRLLRVELEQDDGTRIEQEDPSFKQGITEFCDDVLTQYRTYMAYRKGEGLPRNPEGAFYWVRKAAHNPHPSKLQDKYHVANMFINGSAAKCDLADMYQLGLGVDRDYDQARHWYELSSAQNNEIARYSLGTLYLRGLGVPIDRDAAIRHYQDACNYSKANRLLKKLKMK